MANMAIASVLWRIVRVHENCDNLPSGASMGLEIVAGGTHFGVGRPPFRVSGEVELDEAGLELWPEVGDGVTG
jgi:hypothetical protein